MSRVLCLQPCLLDALEGERLQIGSGPLQFVRVPTRNLSSVCWQADRLGGAGETETLLPGRSKKGRWAEGELVKEASRTGAAPRGPGHSREP